MAPQDIQQQNFNMFGYRVWANLEGAGITARITNFQAFL